MGNLLVWASALSTHCPKRRCPSGGERIQDGGTRWLLGYCVRVDETVLACRPQPAAIFQETTGTARAYQSQGAVPVKARRPHVITEPETVTQPYHNCGYGHK